MVDGICYCGTQCSGEDCFCDDCNGIILECCGTVNCDCPDVPEYEHDTPFVMKKD